MIAIMVYKKHKNLKFSLLGSSYYLFLDPNYGFIFVISFNSGIFHNGNPVVYNYQSIISNFLGLIIHENKEII